MIQIKRNRWVIVRDSTEIFCGLARHYTFKPISDTGNTAIKTYLSRKKAIAAFESSWDEFDDNRYKAVEVIETIADNPELKEVGE